jgi:hypothetical protein
MAKKFNFNRYLRV